MFIFSLVASESVQYFQFDKGGNMFVFEPGSGMSGPSLKVEPGFELHEMQNASQSWFKYSRRSDVTCGQLSQSDESNSTTDVDVISPTPIKRYLK